jgi:hypothetical protein
MLWLRGNVGKLGHAIRLFPSLQESKLFISLVILTVIGLHALPVLQGLLGRKQTFWPVMSWSMYRNSYSSERPVRTTIRRTVAITSAGQEFDIESEFTKPRRSFFNVFPGRIEADTDSLGLGYFAFARFYLRPMWAGDGSAARELAERLNRGREDPIIELRLESETYTVINGGIVKEFNPVLAYRAMN